MGYARHLNICPAFSIFCACFPISVERKLCRHRVYRFDSRESLSKRHISIAYALASATVALVLGLSVYNPAGNEAVTVGFDKDYKSLATGKTAKEHVVAAMDGDIFIEKK